jgi:hypothetical protein
MKNSLYWKWLKFVVRGPAPVGHHPFMIKPFLSEAVGNAPVFSMQQYMNSLITIPVPCLFLAVFCVMQK